jgi:hypothetical protein
MPETILSALKSVAYHRECQHDKGNWPESPKLKDPLAMLEHLQRIVQSGSKSDYRDYVQLISDPVLSDLDGVKAVVNILFRKQ